MTPRAAHQAQITGGGRSCEEAIEARAQFVDVNFHGTPPGELTQELDSGEIEETREGTAFRFCVPDESEIRLELVQVNGEWRVDLVMWSRKEFVHGGVDVSPPCRIG